MGDLVDVDAASRDVGRDEGPDLGGLEGGERLLALALALVAVDGGDLDAGGVEVAGDAVGAALGAREDERARHRGVTEQLDEQRALLLLLDVDDLLGHAVGGLGDRRHRDAERIAQHLGGQRTDFVRHGRGEEQALAALRQLGDDLAERADEAQIHHLVGLVEHQHLGRAEVEVALVEVIDQAAGGGDDDIDAALQGVGLRTVTDAAEHGDDREAEVAAIGLEALGDLGGEFARRRQHEAARAAAHRRLTGRLEAVQDGQREGGRLAGTGLGDAEQVAAFEDGADGLRLDRRRRRVTLVGHGLEQHLVQAEFGKLCQRILLSLGFAARSRRFSPAHDCARTWVPWILSRSHKTCETARSRALG